MKRSEITAIVEKWRQRLVPEFTVEIVWDWRTAASWDDFEPEAHATCNLQYHYNRAEVWFNQPEGRKEYDVHVTVVHELLHMVFRDIRWAAVSLPAAAGAVADAMVGEAYSKSEEEAIDRLARALVAAYGVT